MADTDAASMNSQSKVLPDAKEQVEEHPVDPFLVKFDSSDPSCPQNWSRAQKWYLTMSAGLLVLNATFSSSAPSSVIPELMKDLHMSKEAGILTISLFLAGYCIGPLLWGPLSEQYGRRPIFVWTFILYTLFQIGSPLSKNSATILAMRFLAGTFAAAPLTNSGALISDIWNAKERGTALAIFTIAPFAGPALGPTVAGFVVTAGLSWRWVFWIMAIFAGVCCVQIILTIPETYGPILLVEKAKRIRQQTGDERYYTPMERETVSFAQQVEKTLARPFKILFFEPMLISLTAYMSFVYGCIYLLFEAYPIVFTEGHHFNAGISGLMFLPLPIGGVIATLGYVFIFNPRYERAAEKHAPNPVPPEIRLELAIIGGPLFAISFFWFAWTSYPTISFWAPMMAGLLMGISVLLIFLSLFNYIIDAYLFAAASALAASTVVRSLCGAAFPLFATQMYDALGPQWASSLLGFIAILMVPIPFLLIKFGPTLRKRSRYARKLPIDDQKQNTSAV